MSELNGKLVFVTGVGRGIGKAIALKLAGAGYTVAGCARSPEELEQTAKESEGRIRTQVLDVRREADVGQWIRSEMKDFKGQPWGLVTAAGIYGPIGPFVEGDLGAWREAIDINLYGTLYPCYHFARELISMKKPGRIVLLSGGGATQPIPRFSSYCAAKSAVVRFGETLAVELKPHEITVNSIAPGQINTKFTEDILAAGPEKAGAAMYQKAIDMKNNAGGVPTDKAEALAEYLMSAEASPVTGKLVSAIWDPWAKFHKNADKIDKSDVFTLRRIVPEDRKLDL